MQCKKCDIDIPAQFEFALSKNMCPKCGNKLMADQAMKVYIDLKKRLGEVEFVMDKGIVCERIAMFVVSNYELIPLKASAKKPKISQQASTEVEEISINPDDPLADMTPEEIRAEVEEEARLAALGAEFGMNLDGDEEMVSSDGEDRQSRLERLKAMAGGKSGTMVRRVSAGE